MINILGRLSRWLPVGDFERERATASRNPFLPFLHLGAITNHQDLEAG